MRLIPIFEAENKEILYHGSTTEFDKFDMDKIGTNMVKYAHGICLTENPDVAKQYVTGMHCYIYKVKAYNVASYAHWDDSVEDHPDLISTIIRKLKKAGKDDDAETLEGDITDWTVGSLYEWLSDAIGGKKEASEWFNIAGTNGVIAHNGVLKDIYIAFDDSELKIMGQVGDDQEDDD